MFSTSFFLILFFFCNPFGAYLVFKNKQAFEVSFTQLLHIQGYAFTNFIPFAFLYLVVTSYLWKLRLLMLASAGGISLYYMYKETKEAMVKYLDEETVRNLYWYFGVCTGVFLLLFRHCVG